MKNKFLSKLINRKQNLLERVLISFNSLDRQSTVRATSSNMMKRLYKYLACNGSNYSSLILQQIVFSHFFSFLLDETPLISYWIVTKILQIHITNSLITFSSVTADSEFGLLLMIDERLYVISDAH